MDQVQVKDPQGCDCCGLPLLLCKNAKKVALDGRLSSSYPTMRYVEVGNDQARSAPMHFRTHKGKR